ncbi:hypothetical protein PIB30_024041 [Stylosanthes scabra]|uniref:F-BAR domain-containing protein n=1 Tax=Stylosanthes scabra TaxID=79078 RepID=A0ABU6R9V8_9FABA|nr:hypothetical protein [Stylosanthes scabra]
MRTQTKVYKQGFEDLRVQQHKYVDEIKASQEITHKAVLELRENQDKHNKEMAAHRKEYKKDYEEIKEAMEKSKAQFETANQYWHRINSKNEQKFDYLCWGIQQVNPYLKGQLPEDILEWMQGNLQVGRGRFSDGMSRTLRDCWPGATSRGEASASKNEEDKEKEPLPVAPHLWTLETPQWALEDTKPTFKTPWDVGERQHTFRTPKASSSSHIWGVLNAQEVGVGNSIRLVRLYCLFRQFSWERYPLTVVLLVRFSILAELRIVKSVPVARTPSIGLGMNHNGAANSEGVAI